MKIIILAVFLTLVTGCATIKTKSDPPNPYYNYWDGAWFRSKLR